MTYLWHCSNRTLVRPFSSQFETFKAPLRNAHADRQTVDACTSGLDVVRYCSVGIVGEYGVQKYTSQCIHQQFGTSRFRIGSIISSRLIGDRTDIVRCSQHY